MKRLILSFLIFGSVFLAGCSSAPRSPEAEECMRNTERMSSARWNCLTQAEQKVSQRTYQQQKYNREQEELQTLQRKCDSYGIKRGTPDYSQCLMNVQKQEADNNYRNAQLNQEQERIRQQSLRDFNDAIKPPPFAPLPCPSGMMRGGKCVGN